MFCVYFFGLSEYRSVTLAFSGGEGVLRRLRGIGRYGSSQTDSRGDATCAERTGISQNLGAQFAVKRLFAAGRSDRPLLGGRLRNRRCRAPFSAQLPAWRLANNFALQFVRQTELQPCPEIIPQGAIENRFTTHGRTIVATEPDEDRKLSQ